MLTVDEWAEIRRLHTGEGLGIKAIARRLRLARNTVRTALRSTTPPTYTRTRRPSCVDAVEPRIRELLAEYPRMPTTVLAERLAWTRGITVFRARVAELRPLYVPPEPYQRTEYQPGELAQWDLWFPPVDIPVGLDVTARLPVLVGVSGYSRWTEARMIPSRESFDILSGHLELLRRLGGVPRAGVYDNESAIGRHRGGKVELTPAFQSFRGALGMKAIVLKPGFPEGKGLVERVNRYLETSFLPGRTFTGVDDFNEQLAAWLEKANRRVHRILRCRPSDRIVEDRAAMLALPPFFLDLSWKQVVRLGRDHYVRVGTCDYSVDPRAIGRRVEVCVDLDTVAVRLAGDVVAQHVRSLAKHRTVTDPAHVAARRALHDVEPPRKPVDVQVEERDLAVYDRALGVA